MVDIDLDFSFDDVKEKKNDLGFNSVNGSLKRQIYFPQEGDKFTIIPNFEGKAINSLQQIDVHFFDNNEKVMCLRTIGENCPICNFLDEISNYKTYDEIKNLSSQLYPRSYGVFPSVVLDEDDLNRAVRYIRVNAIIYNNILSFIGDVDYGIKCLNFNVGFEFIKDDNYLNVEPFVLEEGTIKFDIEKVKSEYKELDEVFKVFSEGLGYIKDEEIINNILEEYIGNLKESVSEELGDKEEESDEEIVNEDILQELNEDFDEDEEEVEDEIDEVFNEIGDEDDLLDSI